MKEKCGVIYVLTNPSFPEYVKIGYADDLEKRLNHLNKSECLPFAFRAYCVYEVNKRLKDKEVHNLIDRLNPELRSVETFDGKPRTREFYRMNAEDAYEILLSVAEISDTVANLKKLTPEGHEIIDENLADDIQQSVAYTEVDHLICASIDTQNLYKHLKEQIIKFGNITVEPKKLYIAFKAKTNICDIQLLRNRLKITINLSKNSLDDPLEMAKDMSKTGHWGNGDYIVNYSDKEKEEYVLSLIKQSFDKMNKEKA